MGPTPPGTGVIQEQGEFPALRAKLRGQKLPDLVFCHEILLSG